MKTAFITGINGQDGSYLAEHLLSLNYKVFGLVRRHSVAENQNYRLLNKDIKTYYGDMLDEVSLYNLLEKIKPDEIYNLAGMSHVRVSFEIPVFTVKTNGLSLINLLESAIKVCPKAKIYQASSSEMFGNSIDKDNYQRLSTPMIPVSPYGCSKLLAFHMLNNYRAMYKKFYCNGILFNHESPRRGSNFVSSKIIKTAVEIKLGLKKKLELGNLDSYRDWGHSKDYVRAMHLILQYNYPRDWIVATGNSFSVRDLCREVFHQLKLNYKDHVVQNKKFIRPIELNYLKGDASEIKKKLKWKPKYTLNTMISEMINHWHEILQK
jgi:GDPmannose 4,6-dehydratase